MKKSYRSIQFFKNPLLEKLISVHPATTFVIWTPLFLFLIWSSFSRNTLSLSLFIFLSLAGAASWTLLEYFLHRFVFHYEGKNGLVKNLHMIVHGLHHADPSDPRRLIMPPAGSILIGVFVYLGFESLLGPEWIEPFFSGLIAGYIYYDYVHYAVHHIQPKTAWGRALKKHHMDHHFVSHDARWGVTTSFWDQIFGTMQPNKINKKN